MTLGIDVIFDTINDRKHNNEWYIYLAKEYTGRKIGVLTGGGDAPGLNSAINAIVAHAYKDGILVVGFEDGWRGISKEVPKVRILTPYETTKNAVEGGTIIGTSRTNPYKTEGTEKRMVDNLTNLGLEALIVIGGEDTHSVAYRFYDNTKFTTIGIPKTIDNDVPVGDYCIGFDTAVNRLGDYISDLHTTAKSHKRVMVVQAMGRHTGWLALHGGIKGNAHYIFIPETPDIGIDEFADMLKKERFSRHNYAVIVVSEGYESPELEEIKKITIAITSAQKPDQFGHKRLGSGYTIGEIFADELEKRIGEDKVRYIQPEHLQRAGKPSGRDIIYPSRLGAMAVENIKNGGKMITHLNGEFTAVDLKEVLGGIKLVPREEYETLKQIFVMNLKYHG